MECIIVVRFIFAARHVGHGRPNKHTQRQQKSVSSVHFGYDPEWRSVLKTPLGYLCAEGENNLTKWSICFFMRGRKNFSPADGIL
jgi:hypothetical protein